MHALQTFIRGEFIGKTIVIATAQDRNQEGIQGEIIDESQKTFSILLKNGNTKTIMKEGTKFLFQKEKIMVDGSIIAKRPEDRIKMKIK